MVQQMHKASGCLAMFGAEAGSTALRCQMVQPPEASCVSDRSPGDSRQWPPLLMSQ